MICFSVSNVCGKETAAYLLPAKATRNLSLFYIHKGEMHIIAPHIRVKFEEFSVYSIFKEYKEINTTMTQYKNITRKILNIPEFFLYPQIVFITFPNALGQPP